MRKMMQKTKEKQKGFTLVELLVTVMLLSLVLTLTVQVTDAFYHRYRMIEARWQAQNAARRVMQYFELRSESLSNSASISLFKSTKPQPPVQPATPDSTLPENVMQGVPNEGNRTYAYIYSQPSDPANPDNGNLIYILERNLPILNADGTQKQEGGTLLFTENRPVSLTQYLLKEDVPLNISFHVSTQAEDVEYETLDDGSPTYVYGGGQEDYLLKTVDVVITTPRSVGGNYQLRTSFTMNNMAGNQRINYEGEDLTPTTPGDATIGIAGWSNPELNADGKCPAKVADYPFAQDPANILRYVSTSSFIESQNINGQGIDIQGAGLCFGRLSMRGSKFEAQTIGALHDFRDNVLSKTALGQRVIDAYYHTISPALLSAATEHPSLLKVGKAILLPTSFIACLVAD